MSISTFSPALVLLFVGFLLWVTMDVRFEDFSPAQKRIIPLLFLLLMLFNHLLKAQLGPSLFGRVIPFSMHIPIFLIFLHITKCGVVKMAFMTFTAMIFTAPTIMIGNIVKLFVSESSWILLLFNLFSYALTLLVVVLLFRKGFNYLLKYGDDRLFLQLSLVPFLYYIYVIIGIRADFSSLNTPIGFAVRYIPNIQVFFFYFLLTQIYKDLSEKKLMEDSQYTLAQELDSAKSQIKFLQTAQQQEAIYRHDIRHHMTALSGLLSSGKPEQAEEYIKNVLGYTSSITPKRFCENELVNLLCSSYYTKARQADISFTVKAALPNDVPVSDIELCAVLSNGLENALEAVSALEPELKWVDFYCEIKFNKLLVKIKNPYSGKIVMRSGIPLSHRKGHGVGCHSIQTIADHYHGLCSFEIEGNIFIMQLMLPLPQQSN